jgi:hypothetical protein
MNEDFAIRTERQRDGRTVVFIDTDKARFKGLRWNDLGTFGKKKFENLLIIKRPTEKLSIHYA